MRLPRPVELVFLAAAVATAQRPLCARTLVPSLDLDQLVKDSDVIVTGRVANAIKDLGPISATAPFIGAYTGRLRRAEMGVDQWVKGTPGSAPVQVHFVSIDRFDGWPGLAPGAFIMLFLKRDGQVLRLADPYYPSLNAVPHAGVKSANAIDRVVGVLAAVIDAGDDVPLQAKVDAERTLRLTKAPAALTVLRLHFSDANVQLRVAAIDSALRLGDYEALVLAEPILTQPNDVPFEFVRNLGYGLVDGTRNPEAIPIYTRLLASREIEVRRRSAHALRDMRSPLAISALGRALEDDDADVQYEGVIGLGELTGQRQWSPSFPGFQSDRAKYLEHWRAWVRARGGAPDS